jgi:hypothetical protein
VPPGGFLCGGLEIDDVDKGKRHRDDGELMDRPREAIDARWLQVCDPIVAEERHVSLLEPGHHRRVTASRVCRDIPRAQFSASHPAAGSQKYCIHRCRF